ncbi:hypothetical protein LDENG_00202740 [Lucifuga dentata]|nr:hypothetical protein LDENG_00202740 [Lucifuga dentata]
MTGTQIRQYQPQLNCIYIKKWLCQSWHIPQLYMQTQKNKQTKKKQKNISFL